MVYHAATTPEHLQSLFYKQRQHATVIAQTTASERKAKLERVLNYIREESNIKSIGAAVYADFRKNETELLVTEIAVLVTHIQYVRKRLHRWISLHRVGAPVELLGTSSHYRFEPKGNVLIISPWNYPFLLSVLPLVYAIASGNTVILKPSELAPHTSSVIVQMVSEIFDAKEAAVVEGDAEISGQLLKLPFNHIYFTGSSRVGRIVMAAAANHLASVTLELGGKSPAIVDESAHIEKIAHRMAWAKFITAGQTCIAPDYAMVHQSVFESFVESFKHSVVKMYASEAKGIEQSPDYCRIINDRNFNRLQDLLNDALRKGAQVVLGGYSNASSRFFAPTVLTDITPDMDIMKEEIFGPLLPIIKYSLPKEVVQLIGKLPKPLTMYIGSRKKANVRYFIMNTSAGSTLVNDFLLNFHNPNAPFGGVNDSGIGKSGGLHSFKAFSNERTIMKRHWASLSILYPPYTRSLRRILMKFINWK